MKQTGWLLRSRSWVDLNTKSRRIGLNLEFGAPSLSLEAFGWRVQVAFNPSKTANRIGGIHYPVICPTDVHNCVKKFTNETKTVFALKPTVKLSRNAQCVFG